MRREEGDSSKSASYSIGTAKSGPLSLTHTGEGCRAQVERFFSSSLLSLAANGQARHECKQSKGYGNRPK